MLSHSPMFRMKRTFPDAVDGLKVPKTASCRASQGATTRTNNPAQATAAQIGIAGRRVPPLRQARQRSQANARPTAAPTSTPSLRASVAKPTSSPASAYERGWPLSPRAAIQSAAATNGS